MTARHAGYIVVLREDNAADIITALQMVSGVVSVLPVEADPKQVIARARRDNQWCEALLQLVREVPGSGS